MADEMLFTVDASEIVAKLHFAGLQATRKGYANGNFFVNTGIVDDNPMGDPEKIGKTRFDLKNSTGTYYFGYVYEVKYYYNFALEKAMTDIMKLRAELFQDKKILDRENEKEFERFEKLRTMIQDAFDESGEKAPDDKQFEDEKGLVQVRDSIKKIISANRNDAISTYKTTVGKAKEEVAMPFIEDYMKVFAGADNVSDLSKSNIGEIEVPINVKGPNDDTLVKNFQIQPISEQEKAKLLASFKAKAEKFDDDGNKKPNCRAKICFYVEYSLNVGK